MQNKDGSFTKQEYNATDFILKQTKYNPNEKKTTELLYEYNSKNLKLKMLQYTNGNLESYENYEYNAKGQEINYSLYLHDGTILTKSITEYTGENYKTSRYFGPDKLMDYTIFEVTNGLLMKKSIYEDNKLMLATVYNYDSHKNMIKREELLGGTTINTSEEWTYQCDQRNAK